MGFLVLKPYFIACEQQRHRSVLAYAQFDQCLLFLLSGKYQTKYARYCRFENGRFADIRELVALRIQSSR